MRKWFGLIRDAISPMRYGKTSAKILYWFIRVSVILIPVFIVAIIAGLIYCSIKGITISFF